MNFKTVVKLLKDDGWLLKDVKGSHHQYIHPTKPGKVTVPIPKHDDLSVKTLNSILKQAGLK